MEITVPIRLTQTPTICRVPLPIVRRYILHVVGVCLNRIGTESSWAIGAVYQIWNISDFDIRRANANGACVAFTVSVGQSAPKWGVLPLELQWADDKLKIIGHDCN